MDLVDGKGGGKPVPLLPLLHPFFVLPRVAPEVPDDGGGLGPHLGVEPVGVRLQQDGALRSYLVLVEFALREARDEELPDARGAHHAHGVPPAVPQVEVPHHAHSPGIGRPEGEVHPPHAVHGAHVCAELFVLGVVGALSHEIDVVLGEHAGEGVGVVEGEGCAGVVGDLELVGLLSLRRPLIGGGEEVPLGEALHLVAFLAVHHVGLFRAGEIRPDRDGLPVFAVGPEEGEGVLVAAVEEFLHVGL